MSAELAADEGRSVGAVMRDKDHVHGLGRVLLREEVAQDAPDARLLVACTYQEPEAGRAPAVRLWRNLAGRVAEEHDRGLVERRARHGGLREYEQAADEPEKHAHRRHYGPASSRRASAVQRAGKDT